MHVTARIVLRLVLRPPLVDWHCRVCQCLFRYVKVHVLS